MLHSRYGPAAVQSSVNRFVDSGKQTRVSFSRLIPRDNSEKKFVELEGIEHIIKPSAMTETAEVKDLYILAVGYATPEAIELMKNGLNNQEE